MKNDCAPEVCSGRYIPCRGKPRRGYYVVLDEIVLRGPFVRQRDAKAHLEAILQERVRETLARPVISRYLHPQYARTLKTVLRKQEKVLKAAMGAAGTAT